jgi:hypothetical protein
MGVNNYHNHINLTYHRNLFLYYNKPISLNYLNSGNSISKSIFLSNSIFFYWYKIDLYD